MAIDPVSATFAGISAVASIFGGISGSQQASQQNARAEENAQKQQKLLNEQAKLQNEYNQT
jgi:hypothetical protein